MASILDSILKVVAPKKLKPRGTASTSTFQASNADQVLTVPDFREHVLDIFALRDVDDSRVLLKRLFIHDPDMSAALSAYLTVANTEPMFHVVDVDGIIDRDGQKDLNKILASLTQRFDYSKGFLWKQSVRAISENMRYMALLRGGVMAELVVDKKQAPSEIRQIDLATIEWFEKEPGKYVPQQDPVGSDKKILLDFPSVFVSFYHRDPTSIYPSSAFVSSINTISARQQVINDLYRIMQLTGYPRMSVEVLEEVLMKNAPADVKSDQGKRQAFIAAQLAAIQATVANIRPDQTFVHTDSIKPGMLNEKKPGVGMNIDSIIAALNEQNQAGMKTMATILGRGESGVNTASVEARIFSMTAQELNQPVAEMWSQILTMALRLSGSESYVRCQFRDVELRPSKELEPQMLIKSSRLKQDLSLGIITDDEYHMEIYGRIRPDAAPELSGTGFMEGDGEVDQDSISPNTDALGRSISPEGNDKTQDSNSVKKAGGDNNQ